MDLIPGAALTAKSIIVLLVFVLLFRLEGIRPAVPWPSGSRGLGRWLRNGGLWLLNSIASPVLVVPLAALATVYLPGWRPDSWRGPWAVAGDILVLDMLLYFWHRANHVVPLLWRFHAVHHFDRMLDTTSALRFHPGEVLLSALVRVVIIAALDCSLAAIVLFETLVLMAALFHHSNVRLPARFEAALSWVIVTPAVHWVHHHAVRADTDSNYATILSVWDRLFASRSTTRRWARMPIGVAGERRDPALPALLLYPFRKRNDIDPTNVA
jgi:sterol desaturase/sphingolipid hydroxylase (fatty acid hydroxylase superfamily)